MPIIDWSSKRIKIDPGADIQDIIEALQKDLDSKVTAAVLNAALSAEKAERVEGDEEVLENSKLVLTEEDPESGTHNGYILTQGNRLVGHIHTPSIIKNAYLEKDGEITYLVIEFSGAVEPVKIDVTNLIDLYKGSTGDIVDITISNDNVISATVKDGSITRVKVAEDIEESLKKADDAAAYTDERVAEEKVERVAEDLRIEGLVATEKERAERSESILAESILTESITRAAEDEKLQSAIDAEKAAREAADTTLDEKISLEAETRANKDTEIEEAVNAEVERAIDVEEQLSDAIDKEIADRVAAIAEEKADREAKEAEIEASIAEEATNRENADKALEEAYKAADEALHTTISAEIADAKDEITVAYKAADEAIKEWVNDKKYATIAYVDTIDATKADKSELNEKIADEVAAREAGDQTTIVAAKEYTDEQVANKADADNVYTKEEIDKKLSMPSIAKKLPYLYEVEYTSLDYQYAEEHIVDPVYGGCTVTRNGSLIGRNYDWKYNETADFIVRTGNTIGLCGGISELTAEFVDSGEYSEAYKLLPFSMLDGINNAGLYASINVVEKRSMPSEGDICNTMAVRYILDNFSSVDAVLAAGLSIYNHPQLDSAGYETIIFLADANRSVIIDGSQVINTERLTNFHLDGVTFNADGTVNTPGNNPSANGIIGRAQGLERWNALVNGASIEELYYTNAYQNAWYSEFVEDVNGDDYEEKYAEAQEAFSTRERDGQTWQTVHSCVYDIIAQSIIVTPQESNRSVEVSLKDGSVVVKYWSIEELTEIFG